MAEPDDFRSKLLISVIAGPHAGTEFELGSDEASVGRDPNCTVKQLLDMACMYFAVNPDEFELVDANTALSAPPARFSGTSG